MKKVIILMSSPRKKGNTDRLSDAFMNGAISVGHQVEKIYVHNQNIKPCLGCCSCQNNGGNCVQQDNMDTIYIKMKKADILVFASPVYFYT